MSYSKNANTTLEIIGQYLNTIVNNSGIAMNVYAVSVRRRRIEVLIGYASLGDRTGRPQSSAAPFNRLLRRYEGRRPLPVQLQDLLPCAGRVFNGLLRRLDAEQGLRHGIVKKFAHATGIRQVGRRRVDLLQVRS